MSDGRIAIAATTAARHQVVEALAGRLKLPVTAVDDPAVDLLLVVTADRLELRQTGRGRTGPIYADFVAGKVAHRYRFGGGRRQPLARAVGLKKGRNPFVLDATAGLGRDAFVLASLGCRVTMIERSPVIAALLRDALDRASMDDQAGPVAQRLSLICADTALYLSALPQQAWADVIYMDPMYPPRGKSALVKKEMRLFRLLVGEDTDSAGLLTTARSRARFRVVVKRPSGADSLGNQAPSMTIQSPNTRYDVYIQSGFPRPDAS